MTKNSLGDLNNHLFEELERLNDESLDEHQLADEILRAKAMTGIASQIIQSGSLMVKALQLKDGANDATMTLPALLVAKDA